MKASRVTPAPKAWKDYAMTGTKLFLDELEPMSAKELSLQKTVSELLLNPTDYKGMPTIIWTDPRGCWNAACDKVMDDVVHTQESWEWFKRNELWT